MRIGVLDIGSNCAQLQVVDALPGAPPLPAHAVKEPTLLAEAIEPSGALSEAGTDRAAAAVLASLTAARELEVDKLFVFVTAAIRDSTNREAVLDRIETVSGLRPSFLTGDDEARLTYTAAHRWYGWSVGRLLSLDIGGGSLEIALGRDAEPDLVVSLPLGAGRLTREFLLDDPPTKPQLKALRRHVRTTLREVEDRLRWEARPALAVASSKTFKQLARLAGAAPQRRGPFVRRILRRSDLTRWTPQLAAMCSSERASLRGISENRARQIVAGAVVAKACMDALGIKQVDVCPWALREGVLLHHLAAARSDVDALHLIELADIPNPPNRPGPLQRAKESMWTRAG